MFFLSCVTVKSRRRTRGTGSTVVVALDESFDGTESTSVRVTVAVLPMVPVALARPITSMNCELPTGGVRRVEVSDVGVVGRLLVQLPMLGFAETRPTVAGSVSLT